MSEAARVNSTEALKQAKAAMADFSDSIVSALASVDADINRVSSWLNQDRPAYWKRQVRLQEEGVIKIKTDIMRKRIIAAPEPASVVEEEKQLDRAKIKLEHAQKRFAAVKRWGPVWDREALLYKTSTHGLTEYLHRDVPTAVARLERMMTSLEEYTRIAPPSEDGPMVRPEMPPEEAPPEQGAGGGGANP
jgi:hypothetical protein